MTIQHPQSNTGYLNHLPDYLNANEVRGCLQRAQTILPKLTPEMAAKCRCISISGSDLMVHIKDTWYLAPFEGTAFRQFVGGLLVADLLAFPSDVPLPPGEVAPNQVDLPRLANAVASFPYGARLWLVQSPTTDTMLPVGYTFHYPILDEVFEDMKKGRIKYRHSILPLPLSKKEPGGQVRDEHGKPTYCYVFCYAAHATFHHSPLTKTMLSCLAEELKVADYKGISAVTVSGPGSKVAEQFGMKPSGEITLKGETETLYTT